MTSLRLPTPSTPRPTRLDIPDIPQHLAQRGKNRQPIFFDEDDYCRYLDYLTEGLSKYNCQLHAYVLMTNHVHLLVNSKATRAISGLTQSLGRRYVAGLQDYRQPVITTLNLCNNPIVVLPLLHYPSFRESFPCKPGRQLFIL